MLERRSGNYRTVEARYSLVRADRMGFSQGGEKHCLLLNGIQISPSSTFPFIISDNVIVSN